MMWLTERTQRGGALKYHINGEEAEPENYRWCDWQPGHKRAGLKYVPDFGERGGTRKQLTVIDRKDTKGVTNTALIWLTRMASVTFEVLNMCQIILTCCVKTVLNIYM